jgi:hypothetical protein
VRSRSRPACAAFLVALSMAVPPAPAAARSPVTRSACSLPPAFLLRTARGVYPGRSGEIQIVTRQPDFVGPGYPHSGPWPYLQRVPLLLYGPGFIQQGQAVGRPATVAALAPTFAELAGFDLTGAAEAPLSEALVPPEQRPLPPALLVTLVWDGGGRIVQQTWSKAFPNLRDLRAGGSWYAQATVGSSPSVTPAIHATIGTGVFPEEHGLTDQTLRNGAGLANPWSAGPARLEAPTLADLFDPSTGNQALAGAVATEPGHMGMIGHGSTWPGADADLAVLKSGAAARRWGLPGPIAAAFSFPGYVNDVPGLAEAARDLDARDGRRDGRWLDNPISKLHAGFDTPARIPYQTAVVRELIRREGFGDDATTDLLYVNSKLIDLVGHRWSLNSPEMRDTAQIQDADLPRFVAMLNEEVGAGRWVLALTADHGINPHPSVSGATVFDRAGVTRAITDRFDDGDGVPLVQAVRPTQIFLRKRELRVSTSTVTRFLLGMRRSDLAARPAGSGPAFQAAFPTARLGGLPCAPP